MTGPGPVTGVALPGYVLEEALGCGSMGTVHLARRTDWAGRLVAIKRVPRAGAGLARTLRHEAEVLAALDHPHIVRILDLVPDGDGVAIAMQFAAGGSVPDLLARRGRLTPGEVVAVAAPVADALASAHRRGLLHCDVKPANILFTSDGDPLLADFGLARHMIPAGRSAPDQAVVGTAEYLDPAVAAGAPADVRSDIYGLGAVCYELLTGAPPHAGTTPDDVIVSALAGPPPALAAAATGTPPALVQAVERAMARQPADRFADAAAFAAALRAAATATPVPLDGAGVASPDGVGGERGAGVEPATCHQGDAALGDGHRPTRTFGPPPPGPTAPPPALGKGGRRRLVAIGTGLAVAAAAAAVAALPSPERPRTMATSTRPAGVASGSSRPCPAVAGTRVADLDGDGCPSAVSWRHNVAEVEGRRYELGRPGDHLLVGDWDCDGTRTPALYRPSTGEVFQFDGWADDGLTLAATDGGRVPADGRPVVRPRAGGCDRIIVKDGPSRHA
ncbi:MAG: serine/threonine-protein kinase [Acidimicrobiales bacterium]